jgi:hypothetical protein
MFYDLPQAFRQEYGNRLRAYLAEVTSDLFGQG